MHKKFFPGLTGGTLSKKNFFWVKKIFVRKTFDSKYFMIQNSILNTMMRFIWQENNDEMPEIVILWHNFDQKCSHVYALATFLKNFFASKFFLWVSYTFLKLFSISWRKKSTSKFFWSRGFTIYPSDVNHKHALSCDKKFIFLNNLMKLQNNSRMEMFEFIYG